MEALNKKQLIEYIEKTLPDDAKVVGFSSAASDIFDISEDTMLFVEAKEYGNEAFYSDMPEGTTHLLETV